MAVDFSATMGAALDKFGEALTFTPAATGVPQAIAGILIRGAQAEEYAPGDSSVYALCDVLDGGIVPEPVAGDEIATATTVYAVLKPERDGGGRLRLILRQDRTVA